MSEPTSEGHATQMLPPNKNTAGVIFVVIVLAGFLVFLWVGLRKSYSGPVQQGDSLPHFTLHTFSGEDISTRDQSGKVLVINFWASWCKPCESEAAILQQSWEYYQESDQVLFLGVDYVDTESEAKASLDKYQVTYPNGPDLQSSISDQFRISGVPETYIVNQNGKIVSIKIGPFSSMSEIQSIIDPLLTK